MIRLRTQATKVAGRPNLCNSCFSFLTTRLVSFPSAVTGVLGSNCPVPCRFYASKGRRKPQGAKFSKTTQVISISSKNNNKSNAVAASPDSKHDDLPSTRRPPKSSQASKDPPASSESPSNPAHTGVPDENGKPKKKKGRKASLSKRKKAASKKRAKAPAAAGQPPSQMKEETPAENITMSELQNLITTITAMSEKPIKTTSKPKGQQTEDDANEKASKPGKSKASAKSKQGRKTLNIKKISAHNLRLTPIECQQPPVPTLAYDLSRVLFNQGVYNLQDPRSGVYNFDPYLSTIMPIQEFDFNALKQYITSSKDNALITIAAEHGKKYAGSTSSMTSMLAHFHYLLSAWRSLNVGDMSKDFVPDSVNFTQINRAPAATFLHYRDGTYTIDADKEFDSANILSMLGKSMEKLLTLPKEEYEKYRRINSDQITEEQRNEPEAYHYTTMGDFMMRSQLDAHDPRVPGTGMFDLKTRAVVSIRMDAKDFHKGLGYELRRRLGQWESFEREYFDMIRSAFLKYSLQVRMGRMDGIFVAFHNTQRIFGFQYISLAEMDRSLHGSEAFVGDAEFKLSLHLLNEVMDKATARFPKQSLRLHFETRPSDTPFMYVFAKPVTAEDIEEVQGASKAAVEEFERSILGMGTPGVQDNAADEEQAEVEETAAIGSMETSEASGEERPAARGATEDAQSDSNDQANQVVWENIMDRVEETLDNEEHGITSVREAIEDAMEQVGLLRAYSSEESRRYLDSMLEALTGKTAPPDLSPQGGPPGSTGLGGEYEAEVLGTDADGEQEPSEVPDEAADALEPETEIEPAPGPEVDPKGEDGHSMSSANTPSSQSVASLSLKDLILKIAQSQPVAAETRASEVEQESQGESSEQLKLRRFGEILSELKAKSLPHDVDGQPGEIQEATGAVAAAVRQATLAQQTQDEGGDVLAMVLTTKNKINGAYLTRPTYMNKHTKWDVEYSIDEVPPSRAARLYQMMLTRRKKLLVRSDGQSESRWEQMFAGDLVKYSTSGRQFRAEQDRLASKKPVHVLGVDKPLKWKDVFGYRKPNTDK